MITFRTRKQGDNLLDPGGSVSQILCYPSEVIEGLMHTFVECYPRRAV